MSDDYYYSGRYAEECAEAEAQQPVAWITPGGDVSRSLLWCLERCLPGEQPRPLYATQPPSEGEEIMVNTPYDVYILPLQPSGLSSGPRFVVHVPGPEQQPAAPDVEALVGALREEIERLFDEIDRLLDEIKRLLDSREREGDRLDWLLAQLPGDVIRDLVGEMSCTSDVAEWRHRIDKAARFNPRPGEFGG